jgi:hypothetical protein
MLLVTIFQVYKAWVDPEAVTAYVGIGDCNEDNVESLFVEGNGLSVTD